MEPPNRIRILSILMLFLFGCVNGNASQEIISKDSAQGKTVPQMSPTENSQMDDIREAVFRWEMYKKNSWGGPKYQEIYFLSIEGKNDPTDGLIKRFHGTEFFVKKLSQCKVVKKGRVVDIRSGVEGHIILRIDSIKMINETRAEVKGGYHEGNLSGSSNTYILEKTGGKWIVKSDHLDGIA